jgi:hypothetical protein
MVENVICPDIFQKNVTAVRTPVTTKRFMLILLRVSTSKASTKRNIIPKSTVIVVK